MSNTSTFFEHYRKLENNLTRRKFRKGIIEICEVEQSTFYGWLHRKRVPKLAQKAIASYMEVDRVLLFPEIN